MNYIFGFGVIASMAILVVTVAVVLFKPAKNQNNKKKSGVSVKNFPVAVKSVLFTFLFVGCCVASFSVWLWMSELNIIKDNGKLAQHEQYEIWSKYRPFGEDTLTVKADFDSDLIIKEDFPRLDGATAFLPVYSAVAETIYSGLDAGDVWSYIDLSSTRFAYQKLVDEQKDIIFVLQPSQSQVEEAREKNVEFIKTPIFKEAFVFFVNEENPVTGLTSEQIRQIYTGEVTNWKDVGGNDEVISAYQRNVNSGSQTIMEQVVMEGLTMATPEEELYQVFMGEMLRGVAQYSNHVRALGYSFRFYANVMNPQDGLRFLAVDGIEPTPENIADGSYPFTVDVYAVTTEQGLRNSNTQFVIDWLVSLQGQHLIEQTGYVGLYSQ